MRTISNGLVEYGGRQSRLGEQFIEICLSDEVHLHANSIESRQNFLTGSWNISMSYISNL